MCVYVCLPCNKNRMIGAARPPQAKARVMKEGARKGQNEKDKEEECKQGDMR